MSAVSTHSASVSAFSSRASTPLSIPSSTRPHTPDQHISLAYDYAPETVIIVGSGLAALSAASELIHQQIPVHILERQAHTGGNSIKASSGINGVPTRYQTSSSEPKKVKSDSIATFYADTAKSVGLDLLHTSFFEERDELISTLTKNSAEAVGWLTDDIGVDLSRVARLGGHSFARTHRGSGNLPPGRAIIMALLKQLQDSELATIETGANVTSVVRRGTDGLVIGVDVEKTEQQSTSNAEASEEKTITTTTTTKKTLTGPVIFAAGGFAGDSQGLLHRYRPDLADYPSTNDALPGSARLLRQIGAQLRDMDLVQVHPTGFVDESNQGVNRFKPTKFLAAEALRGEGGILISTHDGKRFVDELQTRKVVTDQIKKLKARDTQPLRQWDVKLVLDQGSYEAAKSHVDFYLWKGLMRKVSVAELQAELDHAQQDKTATTPNILRTLQDYATISTGRKPDPLGRTTFGSWTLVNPTPNSPLYIGTVTPVIHYTMGGVAFNADAEVLDDQGRPIKGLWAAGEITGGLHGGNRLGGSSLLECVVFGRIAGANVARYLTQGRWRHEKEDRDQRAAHYESPA